jgi:hypothetical protein
MKGQQDFSNLEGLVLVLVIQFLHKNSNAPETSSHKEACELSAWVRKESEVVTQVATGAHLRAPFLRKGAAS